MVVKLVYSRRNQDQGSALALALALAQALALALAQAPTRALAQKRHISDKLRLQES